MKVVLQRVASAQVQVDGEVVGAIGPGFLLLVGVGPLDTPATIQAMAKKIMGLRLFPDKDGKMNLDLLAIQGSVLVVSQFTLYADCRKGRRPSFTGAAVPEIANALIQALVQELIQLGASPVAQGRFGADMAVSLVNDGPVTILLDSQELGMP